MTAHDRVLCLRNVFSSVPSPFRALRCLANIIWWYIFIDILRNRWLGRFIMCALFWDKTLQNIHKHMRATTSTRSTLLSAPSSPAPQVHQKHVLRLLNTKWASEFTSMQRKDCLKTLLKDTTTKNEPQTCTTFSMCLRAHFNCSSACE